MHARQTLALYNVSSVDRRIRITKFCYKVLCRKNLQLTSSSVGGQ